MALRAFDGCVPFRPSKHDVRQASLMVKDQSCGMDVEPAKAKFSTTKDGKKYYFCSKDCLDKFQGKPAKSHSCALSITWMHCASCSTTIESALKKIGGVTKANVNYVTGRGLVDFDAARVTEEQLVEAVKKAGFGAAPGHEATPFAKSEAVGTSVLLDIVGMESAHCQGIVEGALNKAKGVTYVKVNLATQKAEVRYDPAVQTVEGLIQAV